MADVRAFLKRLVLQFLAEEPERNAGFRAMVRRLSARGLIVAGSLGLAATAFYVLSMWILQGKTIEFSYANASTGAAVVMWDKLAIMLASVIAIAAGFTPTGRKHGRKLVAALVLIATVAMLMDDAAAGKAWFASTYVTYVLIIAAGTMPYKPWQILVLAMATVMVSVLSLKLLPPLFGTSLEDVTGIHLIYLTLISIVVTGITALIYFTRYEQFLARERAETMRLELERRARALAEANRIQEAQSKRLVELESARDRFFANVSHELRTPLSLILGPIDDLLEADGPEDGAAVRRRLGIARHAGHQLEGLIGDLLDLARLDGGVLHCEPRPGDVARFLSDTAAGYVPTAERRSVALELEVEAPLRARFDRHLMEQAVGNLLDNAFKFTPAGGRVRLAARAAGPSSVEITVRDNGIGIDRELAPHIFDRFVTSTNDGERGGMGIGLALTREVVELHGGRIEVESEPGFGAVFTIILPDIREADQDEPRVIVTEITPEAPEAPSDAHDEDDDRPRVLVVDDNPDVRAYLTMILGEQYRVLTAAEGGAAMEIAAACEPALIIADLMMPHVDGMELCQRVKADPQLGHIPVLILTARAELLDRLAALEVGADDYLTKPFNARELLTRTENLIEIRALLRERFSRTLVLEGSEVEVESVDEVFLKRVREAVEQHIGDSNYGVEWLADDVGLSARQLQRRMRRIGGLSASGYIRYLRMHRAASLIEQHAGNVSEVAYAVGFRDVDHFSRLFKQAFGTSPSTYGESSNAAPVAPEEAV